MLKVSKITEVFYFVINFSLKLFVLSTITDESFCCVRHFGFEHVSAMFPSLAIFFCQYICSYRYRFFINILEVHFTAFLAEDFVIETEIS